MSWQDRDDASDERSGLGRPGGDWQGMRPSFDNPFTWALDIGRVNGISIRIHVLFLVYIVIMLWRSAMPVSSNQTLAPLDFRLMAIAMAGLFVIVLAHELGHCLACRWVGGRADEILMWPLGGLAFCRPGQNWRAHLITAIGGPAVNLIICLISGGALGFLTHQFWGVAFPNLLTLRGVYDTVVSQSLAHQTLFLINALSLALLLFNLLPIFPLDGGRIVQAAFWPVMGYTRSMQLAVRIGYVGAIVLGIVGAVLSQWELMGIALFGGVTCYITQKQLQWTDATLGLESDEYALSLHGAKEDDAPTRATRRERLAQRRALREQEEAREVDRILQKIADSGLPSLSREERALLKRATERKRRER